MNVSERTPNVFADASLDRLSFRRHDEQWFLEELESHRVKIYPVYSDRLAVSQTRDNPRLADLPLDIARQYIESGHTTVFLGSDESHSHFALEIFEHIEIQDAEFDDLRPLATLLPASEAGLFAYARAMMHWHRTHTYCGQCGSKTLIMASGHQRKCSNQACTVSSIFPRTDPAVIVLVEKDNRCLLGRQVQWANNTFSTLAGFVEPGESLEQAVAREVYEESGVQVCDVVYHSSQPWPFPAAIMLGFFARATTDDIELIDGELAEARWFSRDDIVRCLRSSEIGLPSSLSIAYRLVRDWFLLDPNYSAADLETG